ncbi:hypothetical protein WK77_16340 [Burkholderia ubonensis]|nr:hypothetical protein WK77_16340 [Burkholderia ubonensis]
MSDAQQEVMLNLFLRYATPSRTPDNETGAEGANWIPVARQIPARGESVLVAVQFDHADDWRVKVGGLSDEGAWTVFGASWTPSHWMPLPAAPGASHSPAMAAAAPADERAGVKRTTFPEGCRSQECEDCKWAQREGVSLCEGCEALANRAAASPAAEASLDSGDILADAYISAVAARSMTDAQIDETRSNLDARGSSLYEPHQWQIEMRRRFARAIIAAAPQPAQADARDEEAYVAKRMTEALATVYATIIGDDPVDAEDGLNAIERVVRAAQVLRLEVDLYRAQADAPADGTYLTANERDQIVSALAASLPRSTEEYRQQICDAIRAAGVPAEAPESITRESALAAIDEFELVCDNNDARNLTDGEKFAVSEFVISLFENAPLIGSASERRPITYISTQATNCASCGEHKHTPLRIDWMGGYVCLTCIDRELESRSLGVAVAVAAIQYALNADEGMEWLACWNEGRFDACRREWPDAPEQCYIGADSFHPKDQQQSRAGALTDLRAEDQ